MKFFRKTGFSRLSKVVVGFTMFSMSTGLISSSFVLLGQVSVVYAAGDASETTYTLLQPLPELTPGNSKIDLMKTINFEDYLNYAVTFAISIAAVGAVVMIIWGGFEYMLSAIPTIKTNGLDKVKDALFGLLFVLCSYLILKTVDPNLITIPTDFLPKASVNANNYTSHLVNNIQSRLDKFQGVEEERKHIQDLYEENKKIESEIADLEAKKQELLELNPSSDPESPQDSDVMELERQIGQKRIKLNDNLAEAETISGKALMTIYEVQASQNYDLKKNSNDRNNLELIDRQVMKFSREISDRATTTKKELKALGSYGERVNEIANAEHLAKANLYVWAAQTKWTIYSSLSYRTVDKTDFKKFLDIAYSLASEIDASTTEGASLRKSLQSKISVIKNMVK
jgi:hypothetical protein